MFFRSEEDMAHFKELQPSIPSWNYMFMLEAMTYKVTVELDGTMDINPTELTVQAWSNQYDRDNNEGKWHAINLKYIETKNGNQLVFGNSDIITSANDFNFTYRMKCAGDKDWRWAASYGEDGFAHVEPPRDYDEWTKGPNYDHILGSVNLGNFIAATNAKECGFTHVLNVAENLDMVYPDGGVNYLKIAMRDGACNSIENDKIKQAVEWLKANDTPDHKILVNCRAGIGRAGSVAVAYCFARLADISYEDSYKHVSERRFVYPHYGLKDTLYELYPRTQ